MARDLSLFIKQLIKNPDEVVALAPSSAELAAAMVAHVAADEHVIELGAGTGKITRAILNRGVAPQNITAYEMNADFVDHLHQEFPGVNIQHAPAQAMMDLPAGSADHVISGLPLLSMKPETQRAIVMAAFHALKPGGGFVQFTYGPKPPINQNLRQVMRLEWTKSERIWNNLPPARVYHFTQQSC
jgi:phosphatidylethanolamine/phosphatidyl-N-methylethanolamine N-methyltransferase